MANTYTLSDKPARITVKPSVTFQGGEEATDYIIDISYTVTATDGTDTIVSSIVARSTDPSAKAKGDFVEFDDLTGCPPALYAQIETKFNDEAYRLEVDDILAGSKNEPRKKDCPW